MRDLAVARRYGQALLDLASEKNMLDQFEKELTHVLDVIEENHELKKMLEHQLINPEVKQEIFRKVYSKTISPITMNFLLLVLKKRREEVLKQIVDQYITMANEVRGITKAQVRTATPLSSQQLEKLRKSLEKTTNKNILLEVTVDEKLIGGLVVKIGDKIIDGSTSTKLKMLEKHLKNTSFEQE
jgi:F-type H+-transporting ATPase subunit delta